VITERLAAGDGDEVFSLFTEALWHLARLPPRCAPPRRALQAMAREAGLVPRDDGEA
jgi:hypothetical protein